MPKKKRKAASQAPAKSAARVKPQPKQFIWPILILALALRLAFFKASQPSPFFEPALLDAKYYHEWAVRIARGDFGSGVFYGLPLYPVWLGLIYNFFQYSLIAAKFAQIALGLGTVYFIYRIGQKLADE